MNDVVRTGLLAFAVAALTIGGTGVPAFASVASPQDTHLCSPIANGDYVHVSSGQASAHGWWQQGTCSEPYGTVQIQLQEQLNGSWVSVGSVGAASLKPGDGNSSYWVTGKANCASTLLTTWRSKVYVSVGGENTGNASKTTATQNIYCQA